MTRFLSLHRLRLLAALLLVGIASTLCAQTITTFDMPNSAFTQPAGINAAGDVTGVYSSIGSIGNIGNHGFLRQAHGTFTSFDISVPGQDPITFVTSMNAAGQITGHVLTLGTTRFQGFLREADGTVVLISPTGSCLDSPAMSAFDFGLTANIIGSGGVFVTGINNGGQITGAFGEVFCHRSFVRQPDGTTIEFGVPAADPRPGPNTIAQAINSRGQITGYYLDHQAFHGFLREPDGTITTFDASDSDTYPTAITPGGEITGYAGGHGFLRRRDGSIVTFDAPNSISTQPTAINQQGQITGFYLDASYAYRGFVRQKGGTINTFDVPNSSNTYPAAMNAKGEITGWYSDASGGVHGFVRGRQCRRR